MPRCAGSAASSRSPCSLSSRPPRRPPRRRRTPPSSARSRTRGRRGATCSAASGCSGSTTADQGLRQHFMRERTTRGWSKASVPSAWNTGDDSNASMAGGIGWYRKDFKLPSARGALQWAVQFGSVNYRSRVWLNGRPIGTNKGALHPVRDAPRGAQAPRRQPARGPGGLPPAADRLPALRALRPPGCRPAAGGTTAASCARSTSTSSTPVDFKQGASAAAGARVRTSAAASRCAPSCAT